MNYNENRAKVSAPNFGVLDLSSRNGDFIFSDKTRPRCIVSPITFGPVETHRFD